MRRQFETMKDGYEKAINQKDFEAAAKYFGNRYVQHNPNAPDGIEGFKTFLGFLREKFPQSRSEIKRVFADGDYVMVRDPMLVAAFTHLFDRAFDRALPVVGDGGPEDEDQRLVKLLGLGLKDESIARYLGCSLRAVRRRVASLMARHGVQTRFQPGSAVASGELGHHHQTGDR